MARMRRTGVELAKLLDAASRPVYLLDDEGTLVFCNYACAKWLGRQPNELIGLRCRYHSTSADGTAEALSAGLCPPPGALAGQPTTGGVAVIDGDGRLRRRTAAFVPLGPPGDVVAVVALVDEEDLPEQQPTTPPSAADRPESVRLHEQLRRWRGRMQARYRIDRLVGESPAVCRARAQVELAAGSRASVLILGPPGSGRQHVARTIHYASAERPGTLIPLDCSLLGAELIGSTVATLAGHDPRPQTPGASTLLLNQVDQMPREAQQDLVRTLRDRGITARVMATAAGPLAPLVAAGRCRKDLALVLSTIQIELPALVDRREDIPLLCQVFVEEHNARGEKQLGGLTPEALDVLDGYGWPGNVDELAAVVAQAHRAAEGPEIAVGDLPEKVHLAAQAAAHPRRTELRINLDEYLAKIERELIGRAMRQAKGNKTKAAGLLGLSRPRLYRRLEQLDLEPPEAR